jgi:hypothetical protein
VKVHELIAILRGLDGEASVYVMSQPHYPCEYDVAGVAVRGDFEEVSQDGEATVGDRWTARSSELPPSDVFILEGAQLRYGSKGAWAARRR